MRGRGCRYSFLVGHPHPPPSSLPVSLSPLSLPSPPRQRPRGRRRSGARNRRPEAGQRPPRVPCRRCAPSLNHPPPPMGRGVVLRAPGGASQARVPNHTVSAPPSAHPTRKARGPPVVYGIGPPGLCLPSASVSAPSGSAREPLQGRRKWGSAIQKPTAHTKGDPPARSSPPHRRGLGSSQPLTATTEDNRPSSPVPPPASSPQGPP